MQNKEQFEELLGPSAKSDYQPGDTIHYSDGADIAEGTILHTRAAGPVREGGPVLRAGHIVPGKRGWLQYVTLGKVVE